MTVDLKLRDYLSPGGVKPYSALVPDLESVIQQGQSVYLWSVPGFFMLSGHPDLPKRPWSDGDKWYKTAQDALNHKNGRT